ncbi:putative [histone H3]-lysine(4) N-trimethyltransferase chromatin remodeling SET family [Helianthus anomalus]
MNNKNKKPTCITQFQNAAVFILPYLHPTELSSISSTCKTLNLLTTSITSVRSSDASRTFEKHPIPFINNNVDNHPYAYFNYTKTQTLGFTHDPTRQPWGSCSDTRPESSPICDKTGQDGRGCECERFDGDLDRVGFIWECGSGCRIRVLSVRLKIVRSVNKGWGLYADEFIKGGEFVCEYAGK